MEKTVKVEIKELGKVKVSFTFIISWNNLSQTIKLDANLDQKSTLIDDLE